jgi:hypothetical protein
VKDEFAGIKAKCSECGEVVQVPQAATSGSAEPAARAVSEPRAPAAKPAAASPGPRAAKPAAPQDSSPSIKTAAPAAPPPKKAAAPAVAPTVQIKSPAAAAKQATAAAPLIDLGDKEPVGVGRTGGHVASAKRKGKNPNAVLIAIVAGLAVALVGVVGVGALFIAGVFGDDEQVAGADDGDDGDAWAVPGDAVNPNDDRDGTVGPNGPSDKVDPGDRIAVDKGPIEYDNGFKLDDVVYVRKMADIARAIVKFEIPMKAGEGVGMKTGTGFLVDKRGWVATNYHVIENMTTDARAKMANGDSYRIAGIIAQAKERDLAIVKLLDKPFQIMLMDVNAYQTEPEIGQEIFSFGHPLGNDFSLTRGIVSRVLTSGALKKAHPGHLLADVNSPSDQVWIQHDSKISPGNSGGPLFNRDCQVMGVNSFVHAVADFGFASHVRHLREMLENATDQVQPLEEGRNVMPDGDTLDPTLAAAEMEKIFNDCKGFDWTPTDAAQYAQMVRLAGGMATAAGDDDNTARALFGQMRETNWTDAQISATNKLAALQVNRVNQGIFAFAKVNGAQGSALMLQIGDTENFLLVLNVPSELSEVKKDDKVLLLGLVTEQTGIIGMKGNAKGQQQPVYARMVNSRHMVKLD